MKLRLATWNIHGAVGLDRRYDPGRIAAVLAEIDADVLALQEFGSRRGAADLAAHLEAALGLPVHQRPTCTIDGCDFGNAMISRVPLQHLRAHDLSVPGREPRNALEARIGACGPGLRIFAIHLGLAGAERRHQVDRLAALLDAAAELPTVVLGDFNEWRGGRRLAALAGHLHAPRAPLTWPAPFPTLALDRVLVSRSGLRTRLGVHRSRLARLASDHLPLVAEIETG